MINRKEHIMDAWDESYFAVHERIASRVITQVKHDVQRVIWRQDITITATIYDQVKYP